MSCCCLNYSLPNTKLEAAIKMIYFGKDGQAMLSRCSPLCAANLATEMGIYVRQSVWAESSLKFSLQNRTVEKAVTALYLQGTDLQKHWELLGCTGKDLFILYVCCYFRYRRSVIDWTLEREDKTEKIGAVTFLEIL